MTFTGLITIDGAEVEVTVHADYEHPTWTDPGGWSVDGWEATDCASGKAVDIGWEDAARALPGGSLVDAVEQAEAAYQGDAIDHANDIAREGGDDNA